MKVDDRKKLKSIRRKKIKTRFIHGGIWRDKKEFETVYKWIFDENSNQETKLKAFQYLEIWKNRRLSLTPAGILCTYLILEVNLKDFKYSEIKNNYSEKDLVIMYSSALTRFLNYLISSVDLKKTYNMYNIAKKLKIKNFVVNLRHLCAHGVDLPNINVFRRVSIYCMNWLKQHYWDTELKCMKNYEKNSKKTNITDLFFIYNTITEAIIDNNSKVDEVQNILNNEIFIKFREVSNLKNEIDLKTILSVCLKKLKYEFKNEESCGDYLVEFLLTIDCINENDNISNITKQSSFVLKKYELIFKIAAKYKIIETILYKFIEISENKFESNIKRKRACFWAYHIMKSYMNFLKVKDYVLKQENLKKENILLKFNENVLPKSIKKIYKKLRIDCEKTMVFGDELENPWGLHFETEYLQSRIINIDKLNFEVVKCCLELAESEIELEKQNLLMKLIKCYLRDSKQNNNKDNDENSKIFTLSGDVFKNGTESILGEEHTSEDIVLCSDNINWNNIPFGCCP